MHPMNIGFLNYILNGFSAHQGTMITEIAFWLYERTVEKEPLEEYPALLPGQEPPMPFLALAVLMFPHINADTHQGDTLYANKRSGEDLWRFVASTTRVWLEAHGDTRLPEDFTVPLVWQPRPVGSAPAHIEEWFEATLHHLDEFMNEQRAVHYSQDHRSNLRPAQEWDAAFAAWQAQRRAQEAEADA